MYLSFLNRLPLGIKKSYKNIPTHMYSFELIALYISLKVFQRTLVCKGL